MIHILDASFVATAVSKAQYPSPKWPEVAFVGRSNVGKSSMINALAARRKLVRVSNTPGRTRTINFFDVSLRLGVKPAMIRMVDLPGYGFAKASKTDRAQWQAMISEYLEQGKMVKAVVSIIDAEVGPQSDDFTTLDYLTQVARKILVVATKVDRIPKAKRKPTIKALAKTLELPDESVIPFSATEKMGIEEVWTALVQASGA